MWQIPVGVGVGILYSGQSPKRAVTATGITLGASAIVRAIGWRTAGTVAWRGIILTGSGLGRLAMVPSAYLAGAVVAGAIVGTGVSYAMFGKEGAKAAVDFYTDPFDVEKGKTIASIPSNLAAITQGNRAVLNNAASVPAGQQVRETVPPGLQAQHDWAVENRRRYQEQSNRPHIMSGN
jgi:hypothetical protein